MTQHVQYSQIKQYVFSLDLFIGPVEFAIDEFFKTYGLRNIYKEKVKPRTYRNTMATIVEGFFKEHFFKRYIQKTPNDSYLLSYSILRLLQNNDIDMDAKVLEDGIYVDVFRILYDDIFTRLSNDIVEDTKLYTINNNPYMEWDINLSSSVLSLTELGDYRIRRYHELIADGTIVE